MTPARMGCGLVSGLEHGLVSNGRVLGLVAPDGDVAWMCFPRFDGPAAFAGLLDRERGGHFRVVSDGPSETRQRYHDDSLVLQTELLAHDGRLSIDDVCPLDETPRLVRRLTPLEGAPAVRVEFDPRLDYGRSPLTVERVPGGLSIGDLRLATDDDVADAIVAERPITVDRTIVLDLFRVDESGHLPGDALPAADAVEHANAGWRAWLDGLDVGDDRLARRSALTLAALVYRPTGAIIAAATTSIPEAVGEPRNWDYRYCWIRDGAFTADALLRLGDKATAEGLLGFLFRTIDDGVPQPLYRVDGDRSIPEEVLGHLCGFADTRPVRIGNAAAEQIQNDAHGQIVWLAHRIHESGGTVPRAMLPWLWERVEAAAAMRGVPDAGIWEFRELPAQYTFSHLWCWVALDRGARLAAAFDEPGWAKRWADLAADERRCILEAADRVGFFAQTLDCAAADASSLAVAPMGLVEPTDPRYVATIARCEEALEIDGLMRRYVVKDDFGSTTSTFSLCTLWWIEALAISGERERARALLDRFVGCGNPHGLFSEDIEPFTGRLLGNFPQAYTHIGLLAALDALTR